MLRAELVYKGPGPHTAGLQFYGAYVNDEIRAAILAVGWEVETFPASKIDAKYLKDFAQTDCFGQPKGSGLFGDPTLPEGTTNIKKLRRALRKFDIILGRPRKLTLGECL